MADNDLSTNGEFWLYGYGYVLDPSRSPIPVGLALGRFLSFTFFHPPAHIPAADKPYAYHRGTPEAPGRVVTLIERSFWEQLTDHHDSAPDRVWGVAYRIKADKVAEVKDYLDIREINGYTIHYAPFYPADGSEPIRTLVYIGTPDNDQFVGPQDPQALAAHIRKSRGPSGLNIDYLLGLEKALDELSPESGDVHITDLSDRVRAIIAAEHEGSGDVASFQPLPPSAVSNNSQQEASVKEQEETEKIG
ncbi:glutathione-specific gamma-glutamylcyclotransferase [Colletotrichum spaethianum]|uniref:glutathione-specific gamma-glutamylcyclotransferase n=1 Tax=Colletotrichum spaethianum TaxID=700344 RepID=A0AA37L515_9PEZI|nr:glutathione-specific gamma-glutamylcyclotransferase [Colletotrichum spaethianum]GKT40109.1 glutathione-specific gamma-glutamylcyclotransferase [Colletotrichum spaethianum]